MQPLADCGPEEDCPRTVCPGDTSFWRDVVESEHTTSDDLNDNAPGDVAARHASADRPDSLLGDLDDTFDIAHVFIVV